MAVRSSNTNLDNAHALFPHELATIYDMEQQSLKRLPHPASEANVDEARSGRQEHAQETQR